MKKTYVKTPTIFQMEATECGAASLAMILAYHGCFVSMEKIRIDTGVSRNGCNAKNIVLAAQKYGMKTAWYRKSMEGLLQTKPPCIIHWNFNHFVVYEGRQGAHYYINDPAVGRRKLTYEEINVAFTGIVLEFDIESNFQKLKKENTFLAFVKNSFSSQIRPMIALLIIGLFLVLPGILIPSFSKVFIDDIIINGEITGRGSTFFVILIGTVLFQGFFFWYRGKLLIRLQEKMTMMTQYRLLAHLFRLPMNFFAQRYSGELTERVEHNHVVYEFLTGEFTEIVLNSVISFFYLVIMTIYSPVLAGIALSSACVSIFLVWIGEKIISNETMKLQMDKGKMSGIIYAGLDSIDTLKSTGAENQYIVRILGQYANTVGLEQKIGRRKQVLVAIPEAFFQMVQLLIILVGGLLVMQGEMTAGMLVAYLSLLSAFIAPLNELITFVQQLQSVKVDMSRIEEIQRYKKDVRFQNENEKIRLDNKLNGQIQLKNITFGYGKLEKPLLKEFCFSINCGKSSAFVGESGCGKSTILKILSGLYEPWEGEICIDGYPASSISEEVLAASISVVTQEITLFAGTIWDNITMWNENIMEEDVIRAAKDACIHEDITRKPGAYDYYISEGGKNLSGGQRQRIEIARALVTNPTILIMDEATSALDSIIEKEVLKNIKRRGCTCIIVAHRLSAIRDCDEIIVMEDGKIVQCGNHDKLLKEEGRYRKLVRNI